MEYLAYRWGLHAVTEQGIVLLRSLLWALRGVLGGLNLSFLSIVQNTHAHTHTCNTHARALEKGAPLYDR